MASYDRLNSLLEVLIVVAIMSPYGLLIDSLATCSYFYRQNCCVNFITSAGFAVLVLISLLNILSLGTAIALLLMNQPNPTYFIAQFLLSILIDQLQPLVLGLFNWTLHSWEGCLCLPQISCYGSSPCPPRLYPLLGLCPIRFVLGWYNLGEQTYHEDKVEFQKKYPDRIAIDRFKPQVMAQQVTTASAAASVTVTHVETPLSDSDERESNESKSNAEQLPVGQEDIV
jgi:hypothetical protein